MLQKRTLSLILLLPCALLAQKINVTELSNGLKQLPANIGSCRISDGNSVYFIDFKDGSTVLRPVTAEGNKNVWNSDNRDIPINKALVQQQTSDWSSLIDADVYVAQEPGDQTTYLIDHGRKRGIRGETWETCQIKLSMPMIRQMVLSSIPTGPDLSIVLKPPTVTPSTTSTTTTPSATTSCKIPPRKYSCNLGGAGVSGTDPGLRGDMCRRIYSRLHRKPMCWRNLVSEHMRVQSEVAIDILRLEERRNTRNRGTRKPVCGKYEITQS